MHIDTSMNSHAYIGTRYLRLFKKTDIDMKYIQDHITAFILHAVPYLNLVHAKYTNKICFCF